MGREKLSLPTQLVAAINAVVSSPFESFSSERLWFYVACSPEYFNAILSDRITLLGARYSFNPPEHDNWVCPDVTYLISGETSFPLDKNSSYPLNSWDLKAPVDYIPSFEEMYEFFFCARRSLKNNQDKTAEPLTLEGVQDKFIEAACNQVRDFESRLVLWSERQRPSEQSDCLASLLRKPFARKDIKKLLTNQEQNITFAQQKLQYFLRSEYPQFLIDSCHAKLSRECMIADQLKEVLQYTK